MATTAVPQRLWLRRSSWAATFHWRRTMGCLHLSLILSRWIISLDLDVLQSCNTSGTTYASRSICRTTTTSRNFSSVVVDRHVGRRLHPKRPRVPSHPRTGARRSLWSRRRTRTETTSYSPVIKVCVVSVNNYCLWQLNYTLIWGDAWGRQKPECQLWTSTK